MEIEAVKGRLNSALQLENWKAINAYKSVSVLVIYWEDGDVPGFKKEALDIGHLFREGFHYAVDTFAIPTKDSHRKLDTRINALLDDHGHSDHLIIIHYGGHGDPDDAATQEQLSVWAALANGGPTLDWSIIQPKFGQVEAEILLLLDCCFAASAARTKHRGAISSNMELVAACAMSVKTKLPGPQSFTSHLIRQLKTGLETRGRAKVSEVVNALADRNSGYRQTPVHFTGLSNGNASICLEPFNTDLVDIDYAKRESAWLTLRISLRDVVSESLVCELIDWLKAHPTRRISKLTVEEVVSSTGTLHRFISGEERARDSGLNLSQLLAPDRQDVILAWADIMGLLAGLAMQLKSTITDIGVPQHESAAAPDSRDPQSGPNVLLALEDSLLSLRAALQRSILAIPNLYADRESLMTALNATVIDDLGLKPFLDRRLKAQFPLRSTTSMKIDHAPALDISNSKLLRCLFKENVQDFGSVLVEYKYYDREEKEPAVGRMQERVQLLADLLRTSGPTDFHTMRCIRWFHEPDHARFGLMFEPPQDYVKFTSLRDIIEKSGPSQRPTLGQRFSMVRCIGEALIAWHRSANWVHQGIASYNIVFFRFATSSDFDYANPCLCGFEFARPSTGISPNNEVKDFEMDVYRHPMRQGAPIEYHTKKHDLYSFGVFMYEVGVWTLAGKLFDAESREHLAPIKMADRIKRKARDRLGHYMGEAYQRAAARCLNVDFGVETDDPVGSNLARAFEKLVLKEIEQGTRLG
ncbi:MAG: hypothetical protein Q9209_007972 [Squamulea sp. 1 TL-2023]